MLRHLQLFVAFLSFTYPSLHKSVAELFGVTLLPKVSSKATSFIGNIRRYPSKRTISSKRVDIEL